MITPSSPLVNFSTLENLKYQVSVCSCHFDSAAIISHEQEIYRQRTSSGLRHLDQSRAVLHRVGIYSHFWLLLHEYTLLYMYMYMYIDIQHIQYTDSMAPSFVKFCQVYHAFARAHTTVYLGPILLLHEYTLHSYTTKYTLHYG